MSTIELFIAFFGVAFGLWAGVVAFIGHGIRTDLRGIRSDLKKESEKLNTYIVQTETRLAVLESQNNIVRKS